MGLIQTPVEKAERRLATIQNELNSARAGLTPDLDFDRGFELREEIARLERKEAAAVDALAYQKDLEAKAAAEADRAKKVAQVESYRREVEREAPSRLSKIDKLQKALALELDWLKANVDRAEEINSVAREVGVPGVIDGEMHCRASKRRVELAVFEERDIVRDERGRAVHQYWDINGAIHSMSGPCTMQRERVEVSPERIIPSALPGPGGRLVNNIKLTDVKTGIGLWPR